MTEPTTVDIVPAKPADVPLLLALIGELADYEKLRHEVVATEASVSLALFGPRPSIEAVIARVGGEPAGSTFLGKHGLYLEDLFVRPAYRGRAIGKALLRHLAALALQRDCPRLEWSVLDWNRPARDFYEALGAQAISDWIIHRVSGDALRRLAAPPS
jgi:GNAT superfamily N-acetyltransferase